MIKCVILIQAENNIVVISIFSSVLTGISFLEFLTIRYSISLATGFQPLPANFETFFIVIKKVQYWP